MTGAALALLALLAGCRPAGPYSISETLVAVPTEGLPCQVGCQRQSAACVTACGPMADDCYEHCRGLRKDCDLRCPGAFEQPTPNVPVPPRPTPRRDARYPTAPAEVPTASLAPGPLTEDVLRP